jgi:hypothetical protein
VFLKCITKGNITRLYYYESFTMNGKIKQRMIKSLGNLEDLKKQYNDPVTYFKNEAIELTADKKAKRLVNVPIDMTTRLEINEDDTKNVGYGILKRIYKELDLDIFWRQKAAKKKIKYDMEKIFCLLVISRILYPGSKKYTFEHKDKFFEKFDGFELEDMYKALDPINEYKNELQKWIYSHSEKIYDRDMSLSYFDCTNYYFDIGRSDLDLLDEKGNTVDEEGNPADPKYRKRGPEKNHRPDPIVEMGLLMDKNGIPLAYDLFPGNESEKVHMRPIINRVKNEFSNARIIFVADRGLNTSDNIYYLNGNNKGERNNRDGYLYGQSVRGADKEFKAWVLNGNYSYDKITGDDGSEIIFTHKSRIHPKELHVNINIPGRKIPLKKTVSIDQKQMAYYSEKYAEKQRMDRAVMVARAKDLIGHPNKYDRETVAGSASYVKNIVFDKTTGEVIEGRNLELNTEKIEEESKYDGYYSIVTSELSMSDHKMREIYRGLSEIEDTFKISKSDFSSRPVYVSLNEHIDGHFATCFTALVLIRLLQLKLNRQFSVGQILTALRNYNCVNLDRNNWQFLYYDGVLKAYDNLFDSNLDGKYKTQDEIRRFLRY